MSDDTMTGHVANVTPEIRGDEFAATASIGAETLQLAGTDDFSEDGGVLEIDGDLYDYIAVDDEARTITLKPGGGLLAGAAAIGDRVNDWDVTAGAAAADWIAEVTDDVDGSSFECPIAETLADRLGRGVRALRGESVICTLEAGEWTVTGIIGRQQPTSTGMVLQSDNEGQRVVIRDNSDTNDGTIEFYGGSDGEEPSAITNDGSRILDIRSGRTAADISGGESQALVRVETASSPGSRVTLSGEFVTIFGVVNMTSSLEVDSLTTLAQPRSHRTRSGTQSIADNTWTAINFDSAGTQTGVTWGSSQWTVITAGDYTVGGYARFTAGGTTGRRGIRITKNGSRYAEILVPPTAADTSLTICLPVECAASDTLAIEVFQNSGSSQNIAADARGSIRLLG